MDQPKVPDKPTVPASLQPPDDDLLIGPPDPDDTADEPTKATETRGKGGRKSNAELATQLAMLQGRMGAMERAAQLLASIPDNPSAPDDHIEYTLARDRTVQIRSGDIRNARKAMHYPS